MPPVAILAILDGTVNWCRYKKHPPLQKEVTNTPAQQKEQDQGQLQQPTVRLKMTTRPELTCMAAKATEHQVHCNQVLSQVTYLVCWVLAVGTARAADSQFSERDG